MSVMDTSDGVVNGSGDLDGSLANGGGEEHEPCTQPLADGEVEEDEDSAEDEEMDVGQKIYGYLIPILPSSAMLRLTKDTFNVGRSVHNDHIISEHPALTNFQALSKVHFKLQRDPATGAITCEDKSSNGTYLNGCKIGKNKKKVLSHNDQIGMTTPKTKHFIFMSNSREYLKEYPKELRDKYLVSRELGKGACGVVMLGIKKDDNRQVAIKAINKSRVSMLPGGTSAGVENEVKLLRAIDHPCVIRLEDAIHTEKELFIILELADGGELFDKIIEKTKLQEEEAKIYFYQIVSAIQYLHQQNICHRDLKPENILLCSQDDANPVIKVTDLGLSKFVDMESHLKTFCGTPQYLAPEVLFSRVRGDGCYDFKVDMWSLGVILYILLCGCPPFNPDRKDKPLIRQVTEGDFNFPDVLWSKISKEAIELVKSLMTVNPVKRLSADETLEHKWLSEPSMVKKAQELMDSQRRLLKKQRTQSMGLFNGILDGLNTDSPNLIAGVGGELQLGTDASIASTTSGPSSEEVSPAVLEPKENGVFKRPLDDQMSSSQGNAPKKVKLNE